MSNKDKSKNKKPLNPKNVKKEEMVKAIIDIGHRQNESMKYLNQIDRLFGLYIEMNGDRENFNEFIEAKVEEKKNLEELLNDTKADGEADKPNLQGDTDGESSGSEGIREKE